MNILTKLFTVPLCVCCVCLTAITAHAQKFEVAPYAGGFFSGKAAALFDVKNQPVYGIKAGVYASNNFEWMANFGYIADLAYVGTLTKKRAYIWEGLATYNLSRFYGSFGLGGVRTTVSADSIDFWGDAIPKHDTFLSMSYGGGVKALRKWGPWGYYVDVRGRTLPNYNGFAYSWLEATAGVTLSWGNR